MVALKPRDIDRFLERPDPAFRVILLYGPDGGLVSERADRIAAQCGVDPSDPFATIRLDADTAAADRSRLVDEAFTVGMFGGDRLIRVSGTTRRNLSDALKPVLEAGPQNAWIIVEAGDLKKQAALRTVFERSKVAVAIPCYLDEEKAIDELLREELLDRGFTLDRETAGFLRQFLGGDRLASRNELRKLVLYAGEERTITRDHVMAIVGDASAIDMESVFDGLAAGRLSGLEEDLDRLMDEGTSPDMLLLSAMRYFQRLHEVRGMMDASRVSATAAVDAMRPPVFWKRRDMLVRIVSGFSMDQLDRILARLQQASFEARANPELGHAIAGTSLLATALESRRN